VKFSSLFAANKTASIILIALPLYCVSGVAISQPTPETVNTPLPQITVQAPKVRHTAVAPSRAGRHIVSHRTVARSISKFDERTGPSDEPIMAKIERLGRHTSSCADGCQSSFKYGNDPWHGCNASGNVLSFTCRNVGGYKTYQECKDAGLTLGWRDKEQLYYCSSLALK
jgi:hypothetical protein